MRWRVRTKAMTKTDKDRLQFDLASLRKKLSDHEAGGLRPQKPSFSIRLHGRSPTSFAPATIRPTW
ncbi:hypothetical protein AGR7C_Cc160173 [Agrobacterium deltaense Zutra 3/1]|uniref:Uncharacterized protein n=1 Tax=Agrobacterium deltaense Zutra 3/1 TaxID=1183427 RepID=A0A1S7PN84_9HYPH|nr:hypothetical protein AGR7C_Cc160173 [Agrobacterium deltaense Zutra 3/1]